MYCISPCFCFFVKHKNFLLWLKNVSNPCIAIAYNIVTRYIYLHIYTYIYYIANPCGKCGGCPCSSKASQPKPYSPEKRPPRPKIRCNCANNRRTKVITDQVPIADTYTCSRPRPQADIHPAVLAEQCTCKAQAIVKCECPEPIVQEESEDEVEDIPARQPTHAKITCGQEIPTAHLYGGSRSNSRHGRHGRRGQPRQTQEKHAGPCSHCQTQKKEKKCIIQ